MGTVLKKKESLHGRKAEQHPSHIHNGSSGKERGVGH